MTRVDSLQKDSERFRKLDSSNFGARLSLFFCLFFGVLKLCPDFWARHGIDFVETLEGTRSCINMTVDRPWLMLSHWVNKDTDPQIPLLH